MTAAPAEPRPKTAMFASSWTCRYPMKAAVR